MVENIDGLDFREKGKGKSNLFQFSESEHMGFKKSNFNWATIVHMHEKQYPVSFDKHSSSQEHFSIAFATGLRQSLHIEVPPKIEGNNYVTLVKSFPRRIQKLGT